MLNRVPTEILVRVVNYAVQAGTPLQPWDKASAAVFNGRDVLAEQYKAAWSKEPCEHVWLATRRLVLKVRHFEDAGYLALLKQCMSVSHTGTKHDAHSRTTSCRASVAFARAFDDTSAPGWMYDIATEALHEDPPLDIASYLRPHRSDPEEKFFLTLLQGLGSLIHTSLFIDKFIRAEARRGSDVEDIQRLFDRYEISHFTTGHQNSFVSAHRIAVAVEIGSTALLNHIVPKANIDGFFNNTHGAEHHLRTMGFGRGKQYTVTMVGARRLRSHPPAGSPGLVAYGTTRSLNM